MFFLRKVKDAVGLRIIIIYALANFIINSIITITSTNNTFLYESFTLVEYILFIAFVYSQLENKTAKSLIVIISVAFTIFFLTYTLLAKAVRGIDSIPIGIEAIIILVFSFYYLYERMNDTTTLFIYNTHQFWIILGIVLYLAGSFFIYIFASHLRNYAIDKYWFITNIFSILKNIFFCIAIYLHAKPSKESVKYNLELSSLN
jgi:uncharacterized protein (DUF486 family)